MPHDKLDEIFEAQIKLMGLYRIKYQVDIDTLEGQNAIREMMFFVAHELFEASEWLKIKPWRKTIVKTDIVEFKKEMADVVHFFVELCIMLGIDSRELYNLYFQKLQENMQRIKDNY